MNRSDDDVAEVPPAVVVTVTWTGPVPAGDVAVQVVAEHDPAVAALAPNFTNPSARSVPVIVTIVPPAAGPLSGLMEVMAGAGL